MYSGAGAAIFPGRWNEPGLRVIYASEHFSTALVEKLVYTLRLPPIQHYVQIGIPESVSCREWTIEDLPLGWDADDPTIARSLGADWLRSNSSAILAVPSSVAPFERNVLINPAHPDATRIDVGPETPVPWDRRLFPQSE